MNVYLSAILEGEELEPQMPISFEMEEELLLVGDPLCGLTSRSQSMGLKREKPLLKYRRCAGKDHLYLISIHYCKGTPCKMKCLSSSEVDRALF